MRIFLKHFSVCAMLVVLSGYSVLSRTGEAYARAGSEQPFHFGINADNWDNQIDNPKFEMALKRLDPEFIVWHLSPEEERIPQRLKKIVDFSRKNGWGYLFNTELVNYVPNCDYFKQEDGTYRWDLDVATLKKLEKDPLFMGVVYDEPMLMQSMAFATVQGNLISPYFMDTRHMTETRAAEAVTEKISHLQKYYARFNKRLIFEMVFPDYAHPPARAGVVLAPKLLKENYLDLMFSVYAGAGIQYHHKELWCCIDLWFLDRFPFNGRGSGHSPRNLFDALCYAYTQGFDYGFIEMHKGLMDDAYNLTDHGRAVLQFQKERASLPRRNWRKINPKHIVKRFPDGYWGQAFSTFIPDRPYGVTRRDATLKRIAGDNWLALLEELSSGTIPYDANNWNALEHPYFSGKSYLPMAGLPEMLVFDHYFNSPQNYPEAIFHDLSSE